MEPTYHDGSVNLVNRLAYVRREPQRGDVVAIRFSGFKVMLMKRIVGRPGETIEFRRGRIYINGEFLEEPYVKQAFRWNSPPETLGSDQYFVVGDNRAMRQTEHEHGKVDRERIVGKILL
jgi:signal peptidase I